MAIIKTYPSEVLESVKELMFEKRWEHMAYPKGCVYML